MVAWRRWGITPDRGFRGSTVGTLFHGDDASLDGRDDFPRVGIYPRSGYVRDQRRNLERGDGRFQGYYQQGDCFGDHPLVASLHLWYILEYFKEKENGYFKIQHTFAKTSQLIAERYNLDINTVKTAIQQMKNDGYIDSYSEKSRNHNYNVDALYVNWNEAKNAGLIV